MSHIGVACHAGGRHDSFDEAFRSYFGSGASVAAMPPKLSDAQVDDKLVALREYVRDHLEELASRSSACLKAVFARRQNYEEAHSYLFLYKNEARFTEAQRRHVHETFAMLAEHRGSNGGAHPVARADSEALPMASAQDFSSMPEASP